MARLRPVSTRKTFLMHLFSSSMRELDVSMYMRAGEGGLRSNDTP